LVTANDNEELQWVTHNGGWVERTINAVTHSDWGEFRRSNEGWVFRPATKAYRNGTRIDRPEVFLDPGDVISFGRHRDGSFEAHAWVPEHDRLKPPGSLEFANLLLHRGVEPRKYGRVITVLGAMINEDGTLKDVAKARVREALRQFRQSFADGVPAALVFSGGVPRYKGNFPQGLTEAKAMVRAAVEMIKEDPTFEKFHDPLKHIAFLEEKSKDFISNAYFVRRLMERKENQELFRDAQKMTVIVEDRFKDRAADAFNKVFNGHGLDLEYAAPEVPTAPLEDPGAERKRKLEVDEQMKRIERMNIMREIPGDIRAGNMRDIGVFFQTQHDLFKGYSHDQLEMRHELIRDRIVPWFSQSAVPWVKEKAIPRFMQGFRRFGRFFAPLGTRVWGGIQGVPQIFRNFKGRNRRR